MMGVAKCLITAVSSFGPATDCIDHFDFSLFFEEIILTICPSILFIFIIDLLHLLNPVSSARKVSWSWHIRAKQVSWTVLILLNAVQLGATAMPSTPQTSASVASCLVATLAHINLGILSHSYHARTVKPSSYISIYLSLTLVFDIARCRTLWSVASSEETASIMSAAVVTKSILLVLESIEKRALLLPAYRSISREATAGIFNQWFCWWMNPLLSLGYRCTHSLETLPDYDNPDLLVDERKSGLATKWASYNSKQTANSLLLVTLLHNKNVIGKAILPRLFQIGFTFAQPFLVQRVILYVEGANVSDDSSVGSGLILAYMIVYVGIAVATSCTQQSAIKFVTRMRVDLVELIYCRTLEVRLHAVEEAAAITLFSADVERITTAFRALHELWACLIEIALAMWLLSGQLRFAAFAPAFVAILFTGAAISVAGKAGVAQKAWLEKIQSRVATTSSLLRVMKSIKMTGLAESLKLRVLKLRENELRASYGFRKLLVKIVVLTFCSTALIPVASFGLYILLQIHKNFALLDTVRVLTILALLQLLLAPVSILIDALAGILGAVQCFERIRAYLNSGTRVDNRLHASRQRIFSNYSGLLMRSLSSRRQSAMDIDDIHSLSEPQIRNSMTSDLHSLSRVSWRNTNRLRSPNTAHVHGASAMWEDAEKPILKDLSFTIPEKKLTMIIGPVGCGKSTLLQMLLGETRSKGGYIQVAFQDAAYCSQQPWIPNTTIRQNILGGCDFDPGWYAEVLSACCLGEDMKNFPDGDLTSAGSNGASLSGGQQVRVSLARAVYSRKKTMILDDVLSGLDATTEEALFSSIFSSQGFLKKHNITAVLATNATHRLAASDHIIVLAFGGTVAEQGSFESLSSRTGYVSKLDPHQRPNPPIQRMRDFSIDHERHQALAKSLPQMSAIDSSPGDLTVYKYYIESFGWLRWWMFVALCSFYGFGVVFPQAWAQRWARYNSQHPGERAGYYAGIYLLLAVLTIISLGASAGFLVISIAPRVGRTMHSRVLNAVMDAPLSFLTQTDAGSITNRFSQDLDLMDMELPVSLIHTVLMAFVLIAQSLVIVSTAKYAGVALPVCIAVAYLTQKFYVQTSRALRLLDIEAKSLLFSHFLETLEGLATIRAFGWSHLYRQTSGRYIKISQRPFYMLLCVQRWLGLVLDLLVSGIAVVLAAIAVKSRGKVDPGLMGLALLNIVGFSSVLKQLITNRTLLETSTGAVSRVRSFTKSAPSERPDYAAAQALDWPTNGNIEFKNVTASYETLSEPIIKDISFQVRPGQRIGICGRSGSGKSSLLAALLSMLEIQHGAIMIDGVDVSTISRNMVRLQMNALPQLPYLVPGTLRDNVDPLGQNSSDAIIEALELVGLRDLFADLPHELDTILHTNRLSHGQLQLLCLARAMMRHSNILVLDEATASVDLKTEALMQRLISERFSNHTIIAVAHRLHTILDYDYVGVMDAGRIVEWGEPRMLLQKESTFRQLVLDSDYIGVDTEGRTICATEAIVVAQE